MIEQATQRDITAIINFWTDANRFIFSQQIGSKITEQFVQSGELEAESLRNLEHTWVYRTTDQPVGFVVIIDDLIELLVVRSDQRGGPVAERLFRYATSCIAKTYAQVRVEVFSKNSRVLHVLDRLGFTQEDIYVDDVGIETVRLNRET